METAQQPAQRLERALGVRPAGIRCQRHIARQVLDDLDLILDRARENRSQIVYTMARGREMVFWQSPRTRKQARPKVATPKARAAALPDLTILVDSNERYAYRFAEKQVTLVRRALEAGVEEHGATVHFVSAGMDEGPVILQKSVPVLRSDTESSLAARVLDVEHQIYPQALRLVAEGRVTAPSGSNER